MTKERIAWQNPNFRVIDGEGKSSDTDMADRVMEEIGDSFPFKIIEGGGTESTPNDRTVMVVFDSSEIPQIKSKITSRVSRNWDRFINIIVRFPGVKNE